MKTAISIILFWTITSGYATEPVKRSPASETTKGASEFELVKQENNINIYSRWLPVDEKRSARQVKVTFAIDAPAEKALSVLLDDDSFTSWMKGTRNYHRVHTVDSGNWYSYIQFSIPWPLNDQDCIIHYEMRTSSCNYTEILLNGEPDYISTVHGVTRISHMEGTWKLVSAGPNRTLVEYVIYSRQPSSFPRWITDPIIQNNMIRTMTAFRREVTSN
ncbi:MAG: hypothetical protein HQ542_05630 [Bacteroidia bacterium]|nr:hypothetical protein [Bacteroidia bacterium]